MKTTLMEAQVAGNPVVSSVVGYSLARGLDFAPRPSNREWLPVPVVAVKSPEAKQGRRTYRSQIPAQGRAESRIMGLLIFGAAAGVAYGFWMLTQFVENWAGFQAGVRRLVE